MELTKKIYVFTVFHPVNEQELVRRKVVVILRCH